MQAAAAVGQDEQAGMLLQRRMSRLLHRAGDDAGLGQIDLVQQQEDVDLGRPAPARGPASSR